MQLKIIARAPIFASEGSYSSADDTIDAYYASPTLQNVSRIYCIRGDDIKDETTGSSWNFSCCIDFEKVGNHFFAQLCENKMSFGSLLSLESNFS